MPQYGKVVWLCWESSEEPEFWRSPVSRYVTARAESSEGALNGNWSWTIPCTYRCRSLLAVMPRGRDRNDELKQLRDGRVLCTRWTSNRAAAHRTAGSNEENRETSNRRATGEAKLAVSESFRRSAMKSLVGRIGGLTRHQEAVDRSTRTEKLRKGDDQLVQGVTGEMHKHLAVDAFASADQRRRTFRVFDVHMVKWASGDIPEVASCSSRAADVFEKQRTHNKTVPY